ncbi:LOW QUALITY PROTEIN: hypothetical protein V1478_011461 [Vespula squamosa]|uniref:Uncharacterized protein n=1 Tax=Vespula squamosa TaxID=30214 RepID=A0ABD2AEJ6_VESSQ
MPRGILSSVGFCTLAVCERIVECYRQAGSIFFCVNVYLIEGPDKQNIISTRKWNVPYPDICIVSANFRIIQECHKAVDRARSKKRLYAEEAPQYVAQEGNY